MLVGLRTRPLSRVDDEEEEIDARRSGHHRPHEPLVTGDVHDGKASLAFEKLQRRIAEVDQARLAAAPPAAGPCPSR